MGIPCIRYQGSLKQLRMTNNSSNPWSAIMKAGLIAGTLDITCALLQFYIRTGKNPVLVLKFVASGVFGKATAYSGDAMMPLWGLIFHYAIAFIWTIIFFIACSKIRLLLKNWIASAVLYGIFVWAIMAFIVVPLSNTPKIPFNPVQATIGALILVAAIGLPVSCIANTYYIRRDGNS